MNSAFFNVEAERALIAAIVKDRDAVKYLRKLNASDFYIPAHGAIFAAMQAANLAKQPITIPIIAENLKRLYGNDDHMAQLTSIIAENPLALAYVAHSNVEIIRLASLRRKLDKTLRNAREALEDGTRDVSEVLDKTRLTLCKMNSVPDRRVKLQTVLLDTFNDFEHRAKGEISSLQSGIASLDRYIGGFHKGELVVIGARPAVGKSALGLHIALAASNAGFKVMACSREMSEVQYGTRLMMRGASMDSYRMRTGKFIEKDWQHITEAMSAYNGLDMEFVFEARDIESLRESVQEKIDSDGLDLLLVDYMQLMDSRRNFRTEYEQVSYISKALKDMTLDFGICVIALAQVGRSSDGSMPSLAELRGSGAIEQDADIVLFMHKPKSANDEFVFPDDKGLFNGALKSTGQEYVVLDIAKNRQGVTSTVPVLFNPSRMAFSDIFRGTKGA